MNRIRFFSTVIFVAAYVACVSATPACEQWFNWTTVAPMPFRTGVSHAFVVMIEDEMFLAGGRNGRSREKNGGGGP